MNIPAIPHVQPAMGRRQHEMPYTPPPTQPPYPHPYHYHHSHPVQHFHPHQNPQWYQNSMQAPMPRPYQQYPQMMPPQYPMMHNPASLQRSNPTQHVPYSSSIRSHMLSPPPNGIRPPPSPSSVVRDQPSPPPAPPPITRRMPYYPPLPWYSISEENFPTKGSRRRRRRPRPQPSSSPLELPLRTDSPSSTNISQGKPSSISEAADVTDTTVPTLEPSGSATPVTSQAPSEAESTQPTTPSSAVAPPPPTRSQPNPNIKAGNRQSGKLFPIVPIVPHIPSLSRSSKRQSISVISEAVKPAGPMKNADQLDNAVEASEQAATEEELAVSEQTSKASSPQVKVAPKSWADLVRMKPPVLVTPTNQPEDTAALKPNGLGVNEVNSVSDILSSFTVKNGELEDRIAFLKPRGLVNTGNMCYMNSVLQILVFCVPFYDFLDKVGKQAAYSFKSETPLMDAMIMFMREFPIIDSATSVEQLRMRLQDNELEQYGDAFIPNFVYEVIRRLPRFSTMRRGHQQDAEEFLGFLLEELHDECARTMTSSASKGPSQESSSVEGKTFEDGEVMHGDDNGWLEVGPRQKAAITRSSGVIATGSPITKIFGGKLRSELRVPGAKTSVTLESYQPLQLDIGSPQISNISDALKGLTRSETLHGDFQSPRGPGVAATKQVFIETLPPVLILHLKRFQYNNTGGTQKIWKKIGYPLELEIPKEVFPPHRRGGVIAHGGLPKYRLIGVVYHHGKNASGGHYTVDVRRQEGREWVRLDDTVIRRVRSEDVAEGGSEEDPKILAAALEQHRRDQSSTNSNVDQIEGEDEERRQTDSGWNQVNGGLTSPTSANPKRTGVANGMATPADSSGKITPLARYSIKDNKVAYILFYERIKS